MKLCSALLGSLAFLLCGSLMLLGVGPQGGIEHQALLEQAQAFEQNGQVAELRAAAAQALRAEDGATRLAAAQLLDLAASPERIQAYEQVIALSASSSEAQRARRRLVLLHLIEGEAGEARKQLEAYQAAGGAGLKWPKGETGGCAPLAAGAPGTPAVDGQGHATPAAACPTVEIPGPLLAFERMAAIRPETPPEEVLPALARNLFTIGYQYAPGFGRMKETEYLKLVKAWVQQARTLQGLGGEDHVLRVSNCAQAAPVLKAIGYRVRGGQCKMAPETLLEVNDSGRAFLTNNSGFPVMSLEAALQGGRPFEFSVAPVRLPVLFGASAWGTPGAGWIDTFLNDHRTARLYAALSAIDSRTAELLRQSPGLDRLKPVAPVLDYFGRMLRVENGRVAVPGGSPAAAGWKQIVGAAPDNPGDFMRELLTHDDGWAAAWFDSLWYANPRQLRYLTGPQRLVRFYRAARGNGRATAPARSVFHGNPQMLLLVTALRVGPDGKPLLPGGLDFWKSMPGVRATHKQPPKKESIFSVEVPRDEPATVDEDDVMEALFAQTRDAEEDSRLNVFLALNEIDRPRLAPLARETITRLASAYPRLGQYYPLIASWPQLSDAAIGRMLDVFETLPKIDDKLARGDALGSFQALIALAEIAARQGQVPETQVEPAFLRLTELFAGVRDEAGVCDAAGKGVELLLSFAPGGSAKASGGSAEASPYGSQDSPGVHDRMLALLAGPLQPGSGAMRDEIAGRIRAGLEAQRLASLDMLFSLATQLEQGTPAPDFAQLAASLKEGAIGVPLKPLRGDTPSGDAATRRNSRVHLEAERDADFAAAVRNASPPKMAEARALLAPFLRDTLVGFVYAWYAPPGSTLLQSNPLFVRSHDFLGRRQGTGNDTWGPTRVSGLGWPWTGGSRFVGPLFGIAYALAAAEKDFLVPTHTQALIWNELAPQVLLAGTGATWSRVSPRTVHWAALHLRLAEDLLAEAAVAPDARGVVLEALSFLEPRRRELIENALLAARPDQAARILTPAEMYRLSRGLTEPRPESAAAGRSAARESERAGTAAAGDSPAKLGAPTPESAARLGAPTPESAAKLGAPTPESAVKLGAPLFPGLAASSAAEPGKGGSPASIARRASPAAAAIEQTAVRFPQEASAAAVSATFGVPHPKLTRSYRPELLGRRMFPVLMGYSSRLLAETWESSNLYWAALADEMALPPAELNRLVPQATRESIERIFANDLGDWVALLEAMRATGADLRAKTLAANTPPAAQKAVANDAASAGDNPSAAARKALATGAKPPSEEPR